MEPFRKFFRVPFLAAATIAILAALGGVRATMPMRPSEPCRRAVRCGHGVDVRLVEAQGLSYVVAEDDKCQVEVGEGNKLSRIPDCARIGGFRIFR